MKVLFLDIDGVTVNADIQGYVSLIELFGDEHIKDFEYIKKCIKFMQDEAIKEESSVNQIEFIQRVYKYVSNMFEMLKEYRDCFLEWDNLPSFEDKKKYIEEYRKNSMESSDDEEIDDYMKYIIGALRYAKALFEKEYLRVEVEGGNLNLPFETINLDNDIISYDENEDSLKRATNALKYMEIYDLSRKEKSDDFLTTCKMVGDNQIVDYNEIYSKKNLMPGVKESLKHLLDTREVDMIVACSHFTGVREGIAKKKMFQEELPFVLFLDESLLKFHTEPAQMGKRRVRSSKNNRIDYIINLIMETIEMLKSVLDGEYRNLSIDETHSQILSYFLQNYSFEELLELISIDYNDILSMLADDSMPNLEALVGKIGILFRKKIENLDEQNGKFLLIEEWVPEVVEDVFSNISASVKKEDEYVKKLI